MSEIQPVKIKSPFTHSSFQSGAPVSRTDVYTERIVGLYRDQYPILREFSKPQIEFILAQRKLKVFREKLAAEKAAEEALKAKDDEAKKDEAKENAGNADDAVAGEPAADAPAAEEAKKDDAAEADESVSISKPSPLAAQRELNSTELKLIRALELLYTEYYGNEHTLYGLLCKKYAHKVLEEHADNQNTVRDLLLQSYEEIKCCECSETKSFDLFNAHELLNGWFAACIECEPDRDAVATLKWSDTYKSNDIRLKHGGYLCQNSRDGHRYVTAEMRSPVKNGIHCWRWSIKGQRSWMLIGVSKPKKHRDGSYSDNGVYGIASSGTHYKNGATQYDIPAGHIYANPSLFLDVKLNVAKGEMHYMVVGDEQKRLMKMTGLDKNNAEGYVPHANIYYQTVRAQIKKIPPAWFGKNPQRCKFKYD